MDVLGHLDLCGPDLIEGWLHSGGTPGRRMSLQVFLGNELLGECVADRLRPDLAEAGMGDGRCAFSFRIPAGITQNFKSVRLRVTGSVLYLLPDEFTAIVEPQAVPQPIPQSVSAAISGPLRPGVVTIVPAVPTQMAGAGHNPSNDRAKPITLVASGHSA